jgi:hypothetical protein
VTAEPEHLSPDERLAEVARLLADGARRLLASRSAAPTEPAEEKRAAETAPRSKD